MPLYEKAAQAKHHVINYEIKTTGLVVFPTQYTDNNGVKILYPLQYAWEFWSNFIIYGGGLMF